MLRSKTDGEHAPSAPSSLIICSALALGVVAALLSARAVVPSTTTHGLLPRWDLAAHLLNGWTPYDHLAHGRVHSFLWELWTQGYWPPGQSLLQIPFYAGFGGAMAGGLYSSTAAFCVTALGAVLLLGRIAGSRSWLPAAITLGFMVTSPFFLAYGTVAMSEMTGAMAQLVVLVAYSRYDRTRSPAATRWLSLTLTLLFFVKYNYFVLLVVPLAVHEFMAATPGLRPRDRVVRLWRVILDVLATTPGRTAAIYVGAVAAVLFAGGFSIDVAGHRVAFRTVGYSLHILIYVGLFHLWRMSRQGRWQWRQTLAADARLEPFLRWFVVPVTVWLASPHPNHIKDLAYLVINVPMGQPSTQRGLAAYVEALRTDYFVHPVAFVVASAGFVVAALRYRSQSAMVRLLVLTASLQVGMVTLHHTRDPRFLLLAMPLFWIVSGHEIAAWLVPRRPAVSAVLGVLVLAGAVAAAERVTAGPAFLRAARANYVHSDALADALASIRQTLAPGERVAVVGRSDKVSPGLVRWRLGAAGGGLGQPVEVARAADLPLLASAEWVMHVEPSEVSMAAATQWLTAQRRAGVLVCSGVFPVADLGVTLRLFRHAATARAASLTDTLCD